MDWLDLLAVQGTLTSLLQLHSSKASNLQCSALLMVQLFQSYKPTGKTISFTRRTMANTWGNNGNSDILYLWGLQNHCGSDCSHEIRRRLLLGRKSMTELGSVLKIRDITLPTKVHLVKAKFFPVIT